MASPCSACPWAGDPLPPQHVSHALGGPRTTVLTISSSVTDCADLLQARTTNKCSRGCTATCLWPRSRLIKKRKCILCINPAAVIYILLGAHGAVTVLAPTHDPQSKTQAILQPEAPACDSNSHLDTCMLEKRPRLSAGMLTAGNHGVPRQASSQADNTQDHTLTALA